eukprot:COSAG02_NODE_8222_length_2653_cov_1.978074_1_plen_70_part_00
MLGSGTTPHCAEHANAADCSSEPRPDRARCCLSQGTARTDKPGKSGQYWLLAAAYHIRRRSRSCWGLRL